MEATIALHRTVCAKFLPTAVKFYYGFNLRDLSCVFQVKNIVIFFRNSGKTEAADGTFIVQKIILLESSLSNVLCHVNLITFFLGINIYS